MEANLLIGGEHHQIFYDLSQGEKGSYDCPSYPDEVTINQVFVEGEEDSNYNEEDLIERILEEYHS